MKVLAQDLVIQLKEFEISYQSKWEDIRPKIENTAAFLAIESEADRKKIFEVSDLNQILLLIKCFFTSYNLVLQL